MASPAIPNLYFLLSCNASCEAFCARYLKRLLSTFKGEFKTPLIIAYAKDVSAIGAKSATILLFNPSTSANFSVVDLVSAICVVGGN